MLEQNLKVKGSERSEIAKVLSDVRALEDRVRVAPRGRADPLLLKRDKVHRASEASAFAANRSKWGPESEVEYLDLRLGRWLRATVAAVEPRDGGDLLRLRITDTHPGARHRQVEVLRSDCSRLRPRTGNRLKKLTDSRQARHDERLELYDKLRDAVATELQMEAGLISRKMRASNGKIVRDIKGLLGGLADEELGGLTLDDIDRTWDKIEDCYGRLATNTESKVRELGGLEQKRKQIVQRNMTELVRALTDIAHLLPDQIEQSMRADVWQVNLQIVRNRCWHQELLARQKVARLRQRVKDKSRWREAKFRWRAFRHEHALANFHADMKLAEFADPPELRTIFAAINGVKARIEKACLERGAAVLRMRLIPYPTDPDEEGVIGIESPPAARADHLTPANMKENEQAIIKLREEFNRAIDACKASLKELRERTNKRAIARLERLRAELKDIAAKTPEEIDALLESDPGMRPLIEKRDKVAADLFDAADAAFDRHDDFYERIENLGKHLEVVSAAWKKHLGQLYHREVETKEDLYQVSDEHAEKVYLGNDALEKRLAKQLVLLVREPTIEALDKRMGDITKIVGPGGAIEVAHKELNDKSQAKANEHPKIIAGMMSTFLETLAGYFGLKPVSEAKVKAMREAADEAKDADEKGEGEDSVSGADEKLVQISPQEGKKERYFLISKKVDDSVELILSTGSMAPKKEKKSATVELGEGEKGEEKKTEEGGAEGSEGVGGEGGEAAPPKPKEPPLPRYKDGTACLQVPELPCETFVEQFTANRSEFLRVALAMYNGWQTEVAKIKNQRTDSYAALYDQEMRKYRPRIVRIEVDKRDFRREQILGNQKRFHRHVDLITRFVRAKRKQFETEQRFMAPGAAGKDKVEVLVGNLEQLMTQMLQTDKLNVIQTLYNRGNALYETLRNECKTACARLADILEQFKSQADQYGQEFLGSCMLIEEPGSPEKAPRPAADGKNGSTPASPSASQKTHKTFVKDELKFYTDKRMQLTKEYDAIIEELRPNIKELEDRVETLNDYKTFCEEYKELREDLQVMQGLGEKFGAPKRELTLALRTCYAGSIAAEHYIATRLSTLETLISEAARGRFAVRYPPLTVPRSNCVAEQVLETLKDLRPKLIARAEFLHLMQCDMSASKDVSDVYFTREGFEGSYTPPSKDAEEDGKDDAKKGASKPGSKAGKRRKPEEVDDEPEGKKDAFKSVTSEAEKTCRVAFEKLISAHKAARAAQKKEAKGDDDDESGSHRRLPDSGLPAPIEAMLKREMDKASERLLKYQQTYRKQIAQLGEILARGPATVYVDIVTRVREKLGRAEAVSLTHFRTTYKKLSGTRARIERQLKPSLARLESSVLGRLMKEEAERSGAAMALIRTTRDTLMDLEQTELESFVKQTIDTCTLMFSLFDSLVHEPDVVPDPARPPERRTLKHLLRHQARVDLGNAPPEGKGGSSLDPRKFLVVSYQGLALSHRAIMEDILKEARGASAAENEAASGEPEGADGDEKNQVVSTETIKAFKNKCNKMVLRERNNVYKAYLDRLKSRCEDMISEIRLVEADEVTWSKAFARTCDQIRQQ